MASHDSPKQSVYMALLANSVIAVAKAVAAEKSKGLAVAGILFALAWLLAIGAVSALCVAVFVSLAYLMPTWLAGLLTFFIVSAVAGGIGWLGWQKLRDSL